MALREPEVLDEAPFRIVTLLGKGPHGTTYLAEQDDEPRLVSLKMLNDGDDSRDRLSAIKRTLLDCRHPSLVRIVSITLDPGPAVAAAYLSGRRVSNSVPGAARGLADIADAIAYLHQHGIVHGNVRSSNVLALPAESASSAGRWCLIDLAAAAPIRSAADAATDLVAFGRLATEVLRESIDRSLRAIADRALRSGSADGYVSASDLLRDLRDLQTAP